MLLGSLVYPDGRLSDVMEDRVLTAAELYKNQKVKKILVSGDHGRKNYDETNTIKIHLLRLGIPPADIFLDHAGFDTYDSLYRASAVFHVDSAIIVTQAFHLPRAVYIGKSLKIDVVGVIADRRKYRSVYLNEGREIIARIKAFFDVTLSAKPKFLGDVIPINGDGKKSWDKL